MIPVTHYLSNQTCQEVIMDKQDSTINNIPENFGFWKVLSKENTGTKAYHRLRVVCICGKEKDVLICHLRRGKSLSCGCQRGRTHGLTKSPTYNSWSKMRNRCLNNNNDRYSSYGGRGISVCARWVDSFENFLSDMGERPEGCSIGRIDNDGDYCPDNCRWETSKQQSRNKRNTARVLGEDICSASERVGIEATTIYTRIKRGWSEDAALNTPVEDKSLCLRLRARRLGLSEETVCSRVYRGWSEEKALYTPIKKRLSVRQVSI
jgi:hypothetical protein